MTDYTLILPSEEVWNLHAEAVEGAVDILGERNGKFLVNVRGSVPEELAIYHVQLDSQLRVWF